MKNIIIDVLKRMYMFFIKIMSNIAYKKKAKNQLVFLMSFPENNESILDTLSSKYQVIVYYTDIKVVNSEQLKKLGVESRSLKSIIGLVKAISDVTRSQIVFCDNYFAFLGSIKKKNTTKIYQIWHATGAIKKFGLEDKQFSQRSKADQKRFVQVYDSFDYFIVASQNMSEVFINSYGAKREQMLYLGFPRTDELFNSTTEKVKNNKKIILYSPTYREGQTMLPPLDVEKMREKLSAEYHLVIKLHPHVQHLAENKMNDDFVTWQTSKKTDDWLKETDVLITDYSSVAFDFSLVYPSHKLIFYWYDERAYDETTGIQTNMKKTLVDDICYSEDEIIALIKNEDKKELTDFNQAWNTYNDGKVSENIINYLQNSVGEK